MGHQVSDQTVGKLLRGLGFRLQSNRKTREGTDHPDRDRQFEHIDQTARVAIAADRAYDQFAGGLGEYGKGADLRRVSLHESARSRVPSLTAERGKPR